MAGKSGNSGLDEARWQRRAVAASVKQMFGAERWLRDATRVVRSDGSLGVALPHKRVRRIHRIAVALGNDGRFTVPIWGGDERGFVNILDETSLRILMSELDTVTDFIDYFCAKEALYSSESQVSCDSERDLLAVYLHNGRKFPSSPHGIRIEPGSWEVLTAKSAWLERKGADQDSHLWDRLIEIVLRDHHAGDLVEGADIDQVDAVMRKMAREDRFSRRQLASVFGEFMQAAAENQVRSRSLASHSGVGYVFLATGHDEKRELRIAELAARCFIMRGRLKGVETVIGIGTEQYVKGRGYSVDAFYLNLPLWTKEHQAEADRLENEAGLFQAPTESTRSYDEYP